MASPMLGLHYPLLFLYLKRETATTQALPFRRAAVTALMGSIQQLSYCLHQRPVDRLSGLYVLFPVCIKRAQKKPTARR